MENCSNKTILNQIKIFNEQHFNEFFSSEHNPFSLHIVIFFQCIHVPRIIFIRIAPFYEVATQT